MFKSDNRCLISRKGLDFHINVDVGYIFAFKSSWVLRLLRSEAV